MPLAQVRTPRLLAVFPMPGSGPCRPRRVLQALTRGAVGALTSHHAAPVTKPSGRPACDCKGQACRQPRALGSWGADRKERGPPCQWGLHLPQPGRPFPPRSWTGSCRVGQGRWMERLPAPPCLSELPSGPLCSLGGGWLCYQKHGWGPAASLAPAMPVSCKFPQITWQRALSWLRPALHLQIQVFSSGLTPTPRGNSAASHHALRLKGTEAPIGGTPPILLLAVACSLPGASGFPSGYWDSKRAPLLEEVPN